jgi:hypothetical protein
MLKWYIAGIPQNKQNHANTEYLTFLNKFLFFWFFTGSADGSSALNAVGVQKILLFVVRGP